MRLRSRSLVGTRPVTALPVGAPPPDHLSTAPGLQPSTAAGAVGLTLALTSALTFGLAGTFTSGLFASGWSPAAAVTVRVGLAALLLAPFTCWAMRGRWTLARRNARLIVAYAVVAVAVVQLGFFNAITHLSIGVALLIEYLAPVLLVAWAWARHGRRPGRRTVIGALVAMVGLLFALDLSGPQRVDLPGVLWALSAAVGLAVYFVISADDSGGLPPIALTSMGLGVAAVVLGALGLTGLLPFAVSTAHVDLMGRDVPWWVPVVGLAVVSGVIAYTTGIAACRRLGSKVASFVGLTEVVFAIVFAWFLLGQALTLVQFVGGAAILTGVALVRADEPDPST